MCFQQLCYLTPFHGCVKIGTNSSCLSEIYSNLSKGTMLFQSSRRQVKAANMFMQHIKQLERFSNLIDCLFQTRGLRF